MGIGDEVEDDEVAEFWVCVKSEAFIAGFSGVLTLRTGSQEWHSAELFSWAAEGKETMERDLEIGTRKIRPMDIFIEMSVPYVLQTRSSHI